MNNLTFKQKIIFGIIIATMVIFILIYFIMNSGNLTGKEGIDELSEEEGMLDIEDINEMIEGSEENEIMKNGENNKDITLNGEVVNAVSSSINNGKLENLEEIIVHITGEVNKPGIVNLKENSRIADAINAAGGSTKNADLNKINLAGSLTNAPILKNLSKYVYVHGGNAPATTIINRANTIYFSSFDNNIESSWIDGVHYGIWWSSQFPTEDKNGNFIYKDDNSVYMYFKGKWNKITQ